MSPHPHRGTRGKARKQWEAAASAASALYRAGDARTVTEAQAMLGLAAIRLAEAGLPHLMMRASWLAGCFAAPLMDMRKLQDAVAEAAGKLEASWLEMGP